MALVLNRDKATSDLAGFNVRQRLTCIGEPRPSTAPRRQLLFDRLPDRWRMASEWHSRPITVPQRPLPDWIELDSGKKQIRSQFRESTERRQTSPSGESDEGFHPHFFSSLCGLRSTAYDDESALAWIVNNAVLKNSGECHYHKSETQEAAKELLRFGITIEKDCMQLCVVIATLCCVTFDLVAVQAEWTVPKRSYSANVHLH